MALVVAVALALRLVDIENRPMHTDEAVNACLLGGMLEGQTYRYDPQDKHGPSLYYLTYPMVRILGATSLAAMEAWQVRLVPALAGAALLFVLPLLNDGLPVGRGRRTPPPSESASWSLAASALWLGLGAPFVYYGRYWIHETVFVLLTFLLIAAGWRYLQYPRRAWAVAAGGCLGLMIATKETVALTVLAGAVALVLSFAGDGDGSRWSGLSSRRPSTGSGPRACRDGSERVGDNALHQRNAILRASVKRDLLLGGAAAVAVALLFFSSFGAHPAGVVDAVRGAVRFVARASGEGHEKPWFTYLAWMLAPNLRSLPWCGWTLAPFAVIGAVEAVRQRRASPLAFFFLLFAAAHLAIYSAIPYKTPWLMLNFLAPLAVLGGNGLRAVCGWMPVRFRRGGTLGLVALIAGLLSLETYRLCFRFPADPGNPLAYSPTVPDVQRLQASVERFAFDQPIGRQTAIQVVGDDYWPLPWYLRHFEHVGYWPQLPERLSAPVVISTAALADEVARRLGEGWSSEYFGLRPEVLVVVFTRKTVGQESTASATR